jgi:hypothetical protein
MREKRCTLERMVILDGLLWSGAFLLVMAFAVPAFAAWSQPPALAVGQAALRDAAVAQAQSGPTTPGMEAPHQAGAAGLAAILKKVTTPDLEAVAKALGLPGIEALEDSDTTSTSGLEKIGDLDGDGISEAVLKWQTKEAPAMAGRDEEATAAAPAFYLLAWDGSEWQASKLVNTEQPVLIKLLPAEAGGPKALAVIVVQGATQISYPVIFKFQDHRAFLAWDGRSDQTYYQGLPFSEVTFRAAGSGGFPEMIVSGFADPGLLIFPKDPGGERGIRARTTYEWKTSGYFPLKTGYAAAPDYTLYRFIAALHRHDFKAAYALVDPKAFLKIKKPTVDRFRQRVEKDWAEFLDNQVFDTVSDAGEPLAGHSFELRDEDKVKASYEPRFGPAPRYLITGLQRTPLK